MFTFTCSEDLFAFLTSRVANCAPRAAVHIVTYGMYLGITEDGKDWQDIYPSTVRTFIDTALARKTDLKIIVALPYFIECLPGCLNCAAKYNRTLQRFAVTAKQLRLNMRFTDDTHLKYYRVDNVVVSGGINLTTGKLTDFASEVYAGAAYQLNSMFSELWRQAHTSLSYKEFPDGRK